jgi:hypothetical protein
MSDDDGSDRFRPDTPRNPFITYDRGFKQRNAQPYEPFGASPVCGPEDLEKRIENSNQYPRSVSLPPHLFIPGDAQSIDISALANIPPTETHTLLSFRGLKGGITKFIGYAIFNDALMLSLINLVPLVNGSRVLPLHGNPILKFKLGLGLAADMSTLIPVQLDLQPNDLLEWKFTNNDVVDVAAGVRMNGYFSQDTIRKTGRFGG